MLVKGAPGGKKCGDHLRGDGMGIIRDCWLVTTGSWEENVGGSWGVQGLLVPPPELPLLTSREARDPLLVYWLSGELDSGWERRGGVTGRGWLERSGEKSRGGLVQERRNSGALAMELRLSCINQSIWKFTMYSLAPGGWGCNLKLVMQIYMGWVTEVWLSCCRVLLSFHSKTR